VKDVGDRQPAVYPILGKEIEGGQAYSITNDGLR